MVLRSFSVVNMADINLSQLCKDENITITQLDNLATQDLVCKDDNAASNRYASVSVSTDDALRKRREERIPAKTRKQNLWATSVYSEWARWRNVRPEVILGAEQPVPVELANEPLATMDFWLSRFIIECRRKDGEPYPPNTLYQIASSLQRDLRENKQRDDVSFFDKKNPHFAEFRRQLDSRMKELTNEGIGIHRQSADPVSKDDEARLWEKGVIGFNTAKALSYGVFFYNCKIFGFRGGGGGDEHRNLNVGQYEICKESGKNVLVFRGRSSKNVQGGLDHRKVAPKLIKQHEMIDNPRCVVKLFQHYLNQIPMSGPFYRKPLPNKLTDIIDFSSQVVGANPLAQYMKTMFREAGIVADGRRIRNHSGKVTLCTRMYEDNYDEQAIMNRSGHRSTAVRTYKRPSDVLLHNISDSLQPPPPKVKPSQAPVTNVKPTQSPAPDVQSEHSHAPYVPHAPPAAPFVPHAPSAAPFVPHAPPAAPYVPHAQQAAPFVPHAPPAAPFVPHVPSAAPFVPHAPQAAPFVMHAPQAAPFVPHTPSAAPFVPHAQQAAPFVPHAPQATPYVPNVSTAQLSASHTPPAQSAQSTKKVKIETITSPPDGDNCIEIVVPDMITTVVINKGGRKVSVNL